MTEYREGQTATNPKTGQKVVFKGGQWVNAGGGGTQPQRPGMFGGRPQLTGAARSQALQKIASLSSLRKQTEVAAKIYNEDFARSRRNSLAEFLPAWANDKNARYDAALDGLAPLARAAFRVPGSGADSDKESATFMNTTPNRYTNDAGAKQKYEQMFRIIDDSITEQRRLVGDDPDAAAAAVAERRAGFKVTR